MRLKLLGALAGAAVVSVASDVRAQTYGIVFTTALKIDTDFGERGGIVLMRADGSSPRKLTNFRTLNYAFKLHALDLPDDHASCSPDGKKIVFSSSRTVEPGIFAPNDFQLFVMNPNGTNLVQLTNTPGRNVTPSFSPDGTKIAFASERADGRLHIFVMNADGSGVRQLTSGKDHESEPVWSPDGTKIAFTRTSFTVAGFLTQKDVWIMNADGTNVRRLTDTGGEDHDATFSPDGTKIAFTTERALLPNPPFGDTFIIDVAKGTSDPGINLTDDIPFGAGDPSWHPDGSRIVFFRAAGPLITSPMQIWTMKPDGSDKQRITHLFEDGIVNIHPSWCKLADSDGDGRPDYLENQNLSIHQSELRANVAPVGLGASVAFADLTHDGFPDIAAAMPAERTGGHPNAGLVLLFRGSEVGPDIDHRDGMPGSVSASTFGASPRPGGEFGRTMVGCDFDGDGFTDLAIGAPGQNQVFVMRGKNGPYQTLSGTGRFGHALAAADFNGDGLCDLAVGAPQEMRTGTSRAGNATAGAVRVFFGTPNGLSTNPQVIDQSMLPTTTEIGGIEAGDEFGAALAAGKLGGDGAADLVIGVPGEDIAGVTDAGVVHVVPGVVGGQLAVAQAIQRDARSLPPPYAGLQHGARFGEVLAIGKFSTGTGPQSLVVGIPRQDVNGLADAGLVATYDANSLLLAPSLAETAKAFTAAQLGGTVQAGAQLGQALAVGDASGDGTQDLALSAPGETAGGKTAAGAVYLVFGSSGNNESCSFCVGTPGLGSSLSSSLSSNLSGLTAGGLSPATALRMQQRAVFDLEEPGDRFGGAEMPEGNTLAFADLDRDGQADLLIGSPRESAGGVSGAGLVSVRYGVRVGISTLTPTKTATGPGETVVYKLDWVHPDRWRVLDTLHLRLVNDEGVAIWARFRESGEDLMLGLLGDDGTFVEGRAGEPRMLTSSAGSLDLSKSAVQGSGPDGPSVSVTFALVPSEATRGQVFRVELLATDDLGHAQGFEPAGEIAIGQELVARGSGCAQASLGHMDGPAIGAATVGLLATLARRRARARQNRG